MASNCIDRNDQTTLNSLNIKGGVTTNSNGEYTLNQIDVFAKELVDNIVSESRTNPILISQDKYGDSLYNSLDYLNGLFLKGRDLSDYPALSTRIDNGIITPLEIIDFMTLFNLTPDGLIAKGNLGSNNLLFELDRYYANDIRFGSLGGICEMFETAFGRAEGFFNFIGAVGSLVLSAYDFLSKIKNPVDFFQNLAIAETVRNLIKDITTLIKDEINNIIQAFELMLQNFNFVRIIGDITTRIDKATIRTIMQKKDEGCLLMSEENKQTIRDKIIGLFNYAVGLFENPAVAEIQFLITRFCAFISNFKALLLDFKAPMDQFEFKYRRIANRLNAMSNVTTSTAIRNGAIRFSPEARSEQINSIQSSWEGTGGVNYTPTGEDPINIKEPTIAEYSDLPSCSQVRSGTDARIIVSGDWVEDFGMEGWTGLDFDLRVYLMRLQSALDIKIEVTNGWLSQQYNSRISGDPDSSHLSGMSVDISTSGIDTDTISNLAFKSGFRFVKVYDTHIHLDTRELAG